MQPINGPAPLARHVAPVIGKVLVVRLQKAIVAAIGIKIGRSIRAKEDAIGIVDEEAARTVGLAAQLTNARAEINVEVGTAIQQRSHPGQVFGIAANMRANKGGLRVTRDQTRKALKNVQK